MPPNLGNYPLDGGSHYEAEGGGKEGVMDDLRGMLGDESKWPRDTKTLRDLVEAFLKEVPSLDDEIEDLFRRHPEVVTFQTDAWGKKTASDYKLGRIVAISVLNFLFRAYGGPKLSYVPRKERDDRN